MQELAKVTLDNEMDLILAHKRSMKLAELAGLPLYAQTTFATAVSEVARNTIERGNSGCLVLSVINDQRDQYIVAGLKGGRAGGDKYLQGLEYAKRLVNKYHVSKTESEIAIELFYYISPPFKIGAQKLNEWRDVFNTEPSISPYEELKRKNEQLQQLSEKVQRSEAQYKTLTNSLPLIIFTLDTDGRLLYANEWLSTYTGQTINALNENMWKTVVHEQDYPSFARFLKQGAGSITALKSQFRLRSHVDGDYQWHQISLSVFDDEKVDLGYRIGYIVDIHAQKVFEETLRDNIELKQIQEQLNENQQTLEKYIVELNRSNYELQQFAFVASHDLQEPVRKILFYSDCLIKGYTEALDQKGADFLTKIQSASQRMRQLIQDLLLFSQINEQAIQFNPVDLNSVAAQVCQDLEMTITEKKAIVDIQPLPVIEGDERMMRQLFGNIISNALKYTRPSIPPVISVSCEKREDTAEIAFRDNGIGFDEKFLPQMFALFQRLHTREKYEGTGLGLAICHKIVDMHHGRIWAAASEGQGATFYISLPLNKLTI